MTSDKDIVSSRRARPLPGRGMDELMGGMVPRIQDDVLDCLFKLKSCSGAEGGGGVLFLPAFCRLSCERAVFNGSFSSSFLEEGLRLTKLGAV